MRSANYTWMPLLSHRQSPCSSGFFFVLYADSYHSSPLIAYIFAGMKKLNSNKNKNPSWADRDTNVRGFARDRPRQFFHPFRGEPNNHVARKKKRNIIRRKRNEKEGRRGSTLEARLVLIFALLVAVPSYHCTHPRGGLVRFRERKLSMRNDKQTVVMSAGRKFVQWTLFRLCTVYILQFIFLAPKNVYVCAMLRLSSNALWTDTIWEGKKR